MKTKMGINEELLSKVAFELSTLLADEFILYAKTRNAHWNVEGPDFHSVHKFFEDQYKLLDDVIDEIAERVRALGHYAPASLGQFTKLTRLSERSMETNRSAGFMKELLLDHEAIIIACRESIRTFMGESEDVGSSDFVVGLVEKHEKMAWMLRSHLI